MIGITNATVMNMEVGESYNYNGATITCDNNANCVSEFGDTILTGLIQGNSLQYQIIIRVGDDIAYFKDYGSYNFSRRIMEGCFTSLTNGVNANDYILARIPDCSNSSGNFNTWIENANTYGGKLTSLTFNTFGNQGLICWNYNEELGSFCVQFANNDYNEAYDWGMVSPITVKKLVDIGMSNSPFLGTAEELPIVTGYDPITGFPCTTVETLIKYETNYNTGLCYSSTYIMSGGTMQQITPKSMKELRNSYEERKADTNKYINYCTPPATQQACITAFTGQEEKWSIINKIPSDLDTKVLYNYCYMYLTYSGDANTCDIGYENLIPTLYPTYMEKLNEITVTTPGSGSVYDNYIDGNNRDIVTAIPSVISKLMLIFKNNQGVKGIIPNRIIRTVLLAVLFKIFKK